MNNEISRKEMRTPIEVFLEMDENNMVSAKKLYEFLELDPSHYARWCKRNIIDNPIVDENVDYECVRPTGEAKTWESSDYLLEVHFAEELCMTCQNEKGRQARKYFRKVEDSLVVTIKQYNELGQQYKEVVELIEDTQKQVKHFTREIEDLKNKAILAPVLSDWGKETQSLLQEIVDYYQNSPSELVRCFNKNTDEAAEVVIKKMRISWKEIEISYRSKFATDVLPENKFIIIDRLPEYHYDFDQAARTMIESFRREH